MNLTSQERDLCEKSGIEIIVGEMLKSATSQPIEALHGIEGHNFVAPPGLSSLVGSEETVNALTQMQERLPREYQAFHSTRNSISDEEIVVLKTADRLDIVRFKATAAGNYELSNADIIAHLQNWQSRCKLEISGAGRDWINVHFLTLPDEDLGAFAEEVYNFCPDIIDQHFACFADMADATEDEETPVPDAMRELLEGVDWDDDETAGLEILKRSLQRGDVIPLWWD